MSQSRLLHGPPVAALGIDARRARWLFAGASLLLASIALLTVISHRASRDATDALLRAQRAAHETAALRLSIVTAAAGHRAYLLTLDSASLESSRRAELAATNGITTLRSLIDEATETSPILDSLSEALQTMVRSRELVTQTRAAGVAAAGQAWSAPEVSALRNRITALADSLAERQHTGLAEQRAALQRTAGWMLGVLLASLAAAASLGGWAIAGTQREVSARVESEADMHALFDANPDSVLVATNGRVLFANTAAATTFGYTTPGAMRDLSIFDLVHQEERDDARALAQSVIEQGRVIEPRPRRFHRRDGTVFHTEVRAVPVKFAGATAAELVIRDMTERLEAARALERSELQYRILLDAMEEGVVLLDASMTVQIWNPAAERILGLSATQLAGATLSDPRWQTVDEHAVLLEEHEHPAVVALRTVQHVARVIGVARGTGTRAWLLLHAVPLTQPGMSFPGNVVCTFTDITELRESTAHLRESEARYRLLADNSADLVCRQSVDYRFEYVSPSHSTVLGWAADELLGRPALDFLHPDDAAAVRHLIADGSSSAPLPIAVVRMRHRLGHYVRCESIATPVQSDDGTLCGWQVTSRDISLRHTLEERLTQAQKMEAMGRMASGVAHDFNNMLTVIHGSAELLQDVECTEESRRSAAADIAMASERATRLTAQLLTFARLQHRATTALAAVPLLEHVHPLLSRMAGEHVAVEMHFASSVQDACVEAEPEQVEQVLYNLVVNARDAMPNGGTIRIHCDLADRSTAVPHRHGTIPRGRYVVITVSDDGAGMSEEVLTRLFDPFFTTKAQGKGTGLGLATVIGLVTQADGGVTVSSAPGAGSTFTVFWPRAAQDGIDRAITQPRSPAAVPHAAVPTPPLRPVQDTSRGAVVVVDDDDGSRRMVERMLVAAGHRVLPAASAAEALHIIRREPTSLRALVTDVRMPDMSGIELVEVLRAEEIELPVLLISGQLDVPIPSRWSGTLRHAFLSKPFSRKELTVALHELVMNDDVPSP